ncbi:hypothetical protein [Vibrio sonorensis]|uniref:hypothetical protein n=1 Tax=Vibrio sonorensis TaxID=1004316 RepID=UPI0008D94D0E|nr:hypothetical protein [Vibrio sonorensis]
MEIYSFSYTFSAHFAVGLLMAALFYSVDTVIKHFGSDRAKAERMEKVELSKEKMQQIHSMVGGVGYSIVMTFVVFLYVTLWPYGLMVCLKKVMRLIKS